MACSGDDHELCEDSIPVLIRRRTFCDAFVAEARTFRTYTSWLLSMYLSQVIPSSTHGASCKLLRLHLASL